LASVLDLHSKKIIGYAFGKRMTDDLVVKSLKNAYYSQYPDKNKQLIFHSDLGSQYTSNDLKEICKEFNIMQSFSKKGYPYDNACIESFNSSINYMTPHQCELLARSTS
jgi:integrase family protein